MKIKTFYVVVVSVMLMPLSLQVFAANPPICPHVIGWNSTIGTWAQGAPWIKVIYQADIVPAQNTGAKVFYRPYDADNYYHDDGALPASVTGSQFADQVWAKISGLAIKPDAVGYRNEFAWGGSEAVRTCNEFPNYKNRLRALGYTGKVIFGSFGVGWVDSYVWDDPSVRAATDAADGIEVHEYFDLTVNCCAPWLCFRHRDIAIADHPDHLGNKEWYIGEFGSDHMCGNCTDCDDNSCRRGWQDSGKLSSQAMIDQCAIYRAGCANQVVAVFLFQQGSGSWWDFDVMGTPVADWMKTTWTANGAIAGTVKDSGNNAISGATVSTTTGGYTTTTNASGAYTLSAVTPGTYSVVASKSGYNTNTQTGKTVSSGATTTVNFTLTASGGTMNTNVPTGTNLALKITQISTDTNYSASYDGNKARDGSTSTKWCSTNASSTHWIVYDLGASYTVNGFIAKLGSTGGDATNMNLKNFQFQTGTSMSGPWTDDAVVDNSAQAGTINRSYITPKSVRYIRLYVTNCGIDNYCRLPELEIRGTDPGMNTNTPTGTNVALNATSWQADSSYSASYDGSKAKDASTGTKWCSTGSVATHWLSFDLGSMKTVKGFVVKHASTGGEPVESNTQLFSLQSSTSMSGPWVDEVAVNNSTQAGTTARSYNLAKSMRYVRLYITDPGADNYARIFELEVYQ